MIDDFIEQVNPSQQYELFRLRRIIKETIPEAVECISYGMPGFKYKRKYLAGFNAFKDHLSFFPTAHPIEALHTELNDFTLAKGTIQFTLKQPISEELIKKLIRVRQADIDSKER